MKIMDNYGALLLLPISLLLSILLAKALMFLVYFIFYLNNDYDYSKDEGYKKWKERYIGVDNE